MGVPGIPDPGESEQQLYEIEQEGNPSGNSGGSSLDYGDISGWQLIETLPTGGLPGPPGMPGDVPPFALAAPVLQMLSAWASVPDFTPQSADGGGGTTSSFGPISVNLATVRSAEQTILTQLTNLVQQYEALAQLTGTDVDTPNFFGQDATATVLEVADPAEVVPPAGQSIYNSTPPADPVATIPDALIQYTARYALEGTASSPGLMYAIPDALSGLGNVLEGIGQFLAALQQSGDAYASADSASAVS
jgi:hypothetical protein